MKDSFENILISSKRKPNLIKSRQGKEFYNSIFFKFQNFVNNNNIKHYSRNNLLGAVFGERFNRTLRDLNKVVFVKSDSNCVHILPAITKQFNNRVHSSNKLSPIQASFKKNQGFAYNNLLDKRKRIHPKYKIHDLVGTADLKATSSKSDTTGWSYIL